MRMFRNDYSEGAAPEVLEALVATNYEQHVGYTEGDPHCERARELIRAACGREDVAVEFSIGGTSTNLVCVSDSPGADRYDASYCGWERS